MLQITFAVFSIHSFADQKSCRIHNFLLKSTFGWRESIFEITLSEQPLEEVSVRHKMVIFQLLQIEKPDHRFLGFDQSLPIIAGKFVKRTALNETLLTADQIDPVKGVELFK